MSITVKCDPDPSLCPVSTQPQYHSVPAKTVPVTTRSRGTHLLEGKGAGGVVAADAVAVALQEAAEVGEGALLQVHAEGPVPGHQLPAGRGARGGE